jgi:hypothetical protein
VYSHAIDDGVEEEFDRDSVDDWVEDKEAEGSLDGLEDISTYGGENFGEEGEEFMGDGRAERGCRKR